MGIVIRHVYSSLKSCFHSLKSGIWGFEATETAAKFGMFYTILSVNVGSFRFPHILSRIFQRPSSPPFFPAPAVRKYGKSLFFSKKRQSHPKVTLSQKHVVSSNRKEDNHLSLIKILRNYTSTIPYFLIMSTPFTG